MSVPQGRRSSTFTRLLRHGFTDPSAAERLLDSPELSGVRTDPVLLDALGATADPDLALRGLVRLVEALPSTAATPAAAGAGSGRRELLLDTLVTAKPLRDRLLGVLGASEALGDHLARHPDDWHALRDLRVDGSAPRRPGVRTASPRRLGRAGDRPAPTRCASPTAAACWRIAARDVCGTTDVAETAAELADLATATLRAALAIAARRSARRRRAAAGSRSSRWASAAATS